MSRTDKLVHFAPGNKAAPGGARPGSGPKTREVHAAKRRFIDGVLSKAQAALKACLDAEDLNVRFQAAKFVLEQKYGKAAVRVSVHRTSDLTIQLLRDDPAVLAIVSESHQLSEAEPCKQPRPTTSRSSRS